MCRFLIQNPHGTRSLTAPVNPKTGNGDKIPEELVKKTWGRRRLRGRGSFFRKMTKALTHKKESL
jgi:hypothetical protein